MCVRAPCVGGGLKELDRSQGGEETWNLFEQYANHMNTPDHRSPSVLVKVGGSAVLVGSKKSKSSYNIGRRRASLKKIIKKGFVFELCCNGFGLHTQRRRYLLIFLIMPGSGEQHASVGEVGGRIHRRSQGQTGCPTRGTSRRFFENRHTRTHTQTHLRP